MSGCINDSGIVTPKGRHIAQHIVDNINQGKRGHDVSGNYIDIVIDKAKKPLAQLDGRVVYLYRQSSRKRLFCVVVMEDADCVVTAIKNLELSDVEGLTKNNKWTGFRY